MLEHATPEEIETLKMKKGEELFFVFIDRLAKGSILRIKTFSNNMYFIEPTDGKNKVHLYACKSRRAVNQEIVKNGYQGATSLVSVRVGIGLEMDHGRSSKVQKIHLLT